MCVNFRDSDGTVPKHFLNVPYVDIRLKQTGSESVAEHMWRYMKVNGGEGTILFKHTSDGSPITLLMLGAISESTVGGLNEDIAGGIGMIALIIFIAIAAVMFISSGSKTASFAYLEKEKFETEYGVSGMVKERKAKYKDLHTKNNIAGTCLCITALIPLFVGAIVDADNDLFLMIMLSFSFLIAGIGVICFIKTGIIWASYEKLLQEGEYSKENKEKPSITDAVYTAYWAIATAVYLGYSLSSNNWGQSWVIWVVAGVMFCAVVAITNTFDKKSK